MCIVSSRVRSSAGGTLDQLPVHLLITACRSDSGTGTLLLTVDAVRRSKGTGKLNGHRLTFVCSVTIIVSTSGIAMPKFLSRIGHTCSTKMRTVRTRHANGGLGASVTLLSKIDRRVGGKFFEDKRGTLKLSTKLTNSNVTFSCF